MFDDAALRDLKSRVEYENWFLEEAYRISSKNLFPVWPDSAVYPISGEPKWRVWASANLQVGDWRPGFLRAGVPLVFVTTFKLLDMMMEWVLSENGVASTFRFQQKLAAMTPNIKFPQIVESRPWWRDRLVSLYGRLEPLRGTIIHDRHFEVEDGAMRVASSRKNLLGPQVHIDGDLLRVLARLVVSTLRHVDGSWDMDVYRERRLRHDLDQLAPLHGLASMGQKLPYHATVRFFSKHVNPLAADVSRIALDISQRYSDNDCSFDLRVLCVDEGRVVSAYMFKWEELQGGKFASLDPDGFRSHVPDDIDARDCL